MQRLARTCEAVFLATAFSIISVSMGFGQEITEEYEWDPMWGLHEEEWYDPSDWFNDDNMIDIEDTYDDPYYTGDFWTYDDYVYVHGYDYADFVLDDIDYYYQWNPILDAWVQVEATDEASRTAATDGERRQAREPSVENQREQQVADAEDVVTMRGTVAHVARITPEEGQRQHTFVRLDVDRERRVLVDMGPGTEVSDLNISKGDQIQVRGTRAEFDGKYILVAQQVSQAPRQGQQYGARPGSDQAPEGQRTEDETEPDPKQQEEGESPVAPAPGEESI